MPLLIDPGFTVPANLLDEYVASVEDALATESGRLQRSCRRVSPKRRKKISDSMAILAAEELLAPIARHCAVTSADLPGRAKQAGFDYLIDGNGRRLRLQVKGSSQVDYLGWRHARNRRGEMPNLAYDILLLIDIGVACPVAARRLDSERFPTAGKTAEFYVFAQSDVLEIVENPERWNTNEVWIGAWRHRQPDATSKEFRRQYLEIFTPRHRGAFSRLEQALGFE